MTPAPPAPEESRNLRYARWALRAVVLLGCMIGVGLHQRLMWGWFIEDAAISFAYARNLAIGEGLVTSIGGERIEGYSNPTWVALIAVFSILGFDEFQAAKWVQLTLGVATVPLVWLITREAVPERARNEAPLVAVVALASNPQFAIWGTSGLENALFSFFLAFALWRTLVEAREGGWPWSAFGWFLVAISRPEAIMYAAVAGFWSMVFTLQARRGIKPTLAWLITFWAPFSVYHAARFAYFAYEFPQTYYAKLGTKNPRPFNWVGRGWMYVRNWATDTSQGFLLPIYAIAATSLRGVRGAIAVLIVTLLMYVLVVPATAPLQELGWWPTSLPDPFGNLEYRSVAMATATICLPLLGIGAPGWRARVLSWNLAAISLFFAIYAMGDWMKGFRWLSLLAVPAAVLYGAGVGEVAEWFGRFERRFVRLVRSKAATPAEPWRVGWGVQGALVAVALAYLPVTPGVAHTQSIAARDDTSPFDVKRRVDYVNEVRDRVFLDERLVDLDVDQGAHMYWSDFLMLDIAGLVDIPMAQHRFLRPFIEEYIFVEKRPHFAHVHGGWARSSGIPTFRQWRDNYVEIPGYPTGKRFHTGNHLRRDLLTTYSWPHARHRVQFEGGLTLEGLHLPSPEAAVGSSVYVEIGVSSALNVVDDNVRLKLFASDDTGKLTVWDVPLGYDWLPPKDWRPGEIFYGKFALPLPADLPIGTYDLGVALLHRDQGALGVARAPLAGASLPSDTEPQAIPSFAVVGGAADTPAHFVSGELRFRAMLKVVSVERRADVAKQHRGASVAHADQGDCAAAEHAWWLSRRTRPGDQRYVDENGPAVRERIAACWARAAEALDDPYDRVTPLRRAHAMDHWEPTYRRVARLTANALMADGYDARANVDHEAAYAAFSAAVAVEPTRAWARRYAEQHRRERLDLHHPPPGTASPRSRKPPLKKAK